MKTMRKRKVAVVDVYSQTRSSSINANEVRDISEDDVEDYMARNQELWKYFLDDNNFKCDK